MNLPTLSWEEHVVITKADGRDIASLQKPNFECWMRERAALNAALTELAGIKNHCRDAIENINNYMLRLEKDQSELAARADSIEQEQEEDND